MTQIPPQPGTSNESAFAQAFVAAVEGDENETPNEQEEPEPEEEEPEEQPGEEVEEEGEEGVEEEAAGEPVEGEQATQEAVSPSTYNLNGRELNEDQIRQAVELNDFMAGLPPEAIQAFEALLSGQYQLVPTSQIQQWQQQPQQQSQPEESDLLEDGQDREARNRISTLENELVGLRQQQAQRVADENLARVNAGRDSWVAEHSELTQDEINGLVNKLTRSQILPGLVASTGSVELGMRAALDQIYWSEPKYRDIELNKRLEAERIQAEETTKRKRKASSVAGSGGSTSRTPPPPDTSTRQSRVEGMAAALEQAMNQ